MSDEKSDFRKAVDNALNIMDKEYNKDEESSFGDDWDDRFDRPDEDFKPLVDDD